jgi:Flp pilus assembly protein TadG
MRRALSFIRSTGGATAVEFGLVAAPFIGMLMAILQAGLVFFAQEVLQTSTTDASRLIMTGQAQTGNLTAAQFKTDVCTDASVLFSCSGIYVNVQSFSSFSSMTQENPVSGGSFNSGAMNYSAGNPGDIVLVQVFYQWPIYLGPLNFTLANLGASTRLLVGTAVFRNEPY